MTDSMRKTLKAYDQQHLLQFWNELNDEEKHILEEDLSELDFAEITSTYNKTISSANVKQRLLDDRIQPIPCDRISSVESTSEDVLRQYRDAGLREIADGSVAVLLMAGGQGTRLGVNYAKGMYDVGLPSHKTLFQLQAERIRRLQDMAEEQFSHKNGKITWYIMTSEATDEMTNKYLSKNNYFGLNKDDIVTFKQGMLPCFTFEGKVILDEKYRVSRAPDGNGGLYRALKTQGILSDMKKRGIRHIHAHSVDNILIKVADPIFIGYCLSSSADCGVKVIEKTLPTEPIGVVCKVNETFQVVEYSEITKETSELRDNEGKLVYNAGNICNHYFNIDFLDSIVNEHDKDLELHVARKKIPYVDNDGNRIIPTKPNGIKVEKFVFDVFQFSKNFLIWKDIREREFSPLKNSDSAGVDCPTTARNDLLKLHKKWLMEAGAREINGEVEVSPLLSYAGENLKLVADRQVYHGPCVLD